MFQSKPVIVFCLLLCLITITTSCISRMDESPTEIRDSIEKNNSMNFPLVESSYDKDLSDSVLRIIECARNSEDINPSLSLFNYNLAMSYFLNDAPGSLIDYYHHLYLYPPEPGSVIHKLVYEDIPRAKLSAFKKAENDIFEYLILEVFYSEFDIYEKQTLFCKIADLMEKYGNRKRAKKFRENVISGKTLVSCCDSQTMKGPYSRSSKFQDKNNRKLNKFPVLIDLLQKNIASSNRFDRGYTIEIIITYMDSNKISKSEQIELIVILLPEIRKGDFLNGLNADLRSLTGDESIIEMIHKAQSDLMSFAEYMSLVYGTYHPLDAEMKLSIARAFVEFGQPDKAVRELEESLQICNKYDSSAIYLPVKANIAFEFHRLGNEQKAIQILDEIEKSDLAGKLRESEIIDIARIITDVDSRQKADNFVNDVQPETTYISGNPSELRCYLRALWMLDNGEFDNALDFLNKVGDKKNALVGEVFNAALNRENYDFCLNVLNRFENINNRVSYFLKFYRKTTGTNDLELLQKVINVAESLLPKIQDNHDKIELLLISSKANQKLENYVKEKNCYDEALELADKSVHEKINGHEVKRIISLLKDWGLESKASELEEKLDTTFPKKSENPTLDKMFEIAHQGKFQEAIDCLGELECLDYPSETMAQLAEIMIGHKQFDYAMDTIEWGAKYQIKFKCSSWVDKWGMESPFNKFPEIFLNADRIDLALKSLKYVDNDELIPVLIKIERQRREMNYTLTVSDKKSLRRMIFKDIFYIEANDETLKK